MTIGFEVTGFEEGHGTFEVKTQVITSPLTKLASVYVDELMPTLIPFFFHWYAGAVPPLTGTAVNVTLVPVQIELEGEAEIVTLTPMLKFTLTFNIVVADTQEPLLYRTCIVCGPGVIQVTETVFVPSPPEINPPDMPQTYPDIPGSVT